MPGSGRETSKLFTTRNIVLLALLTAIVVVLQLFSALFKIGPFSLTFVLIPITIGAALIGVFAGGWLGLAFGLAVLLSGDATPFFVVSPFLTIVVVLLKGFFAGLASGAVYKVVSDKIKKEPLAALLAAVICPIVNTGCFFIGVLLFFLPTIREWGEAVGITNPVVFIITGMIGFNFLIELGLNLSLVSVVIRLVRYGRERFMLSAAKSK
jgi:uncharacterized membrane protein